MEVKECVGYGTAQADGTTYLRLKPTHAVPIQPVGTMFHPEEPEFLVEVDVFMGFANTPTTADFFDHVLARAIYYQSDGLGGIQILSAGAQPEPHGSSTSCPESVDLNAPSETWILGESLEGNDRKARLAFVFQDPPPVATHYGVGIDLVRTCGQGSSLSCVNASRLWFGDVRVLQRNGGVTFAATSGLDCWSRGFNKWDPPQ